MKKYLILCIVLFTVFSSGCINVDKQCVTDNDCEMFGCEGCFTKYYNGENIGENCPTRSDPFKCVCYKNECSDISKKYLDKFATSDNVKNSIELCNDYVDILYENPEDFDFDSNVTFLQVKAFRLMRCYEVVCKEAQDDDKETCSNIITGKITETCRASTLENPSLCDMLLEEQYRQYCYENIEF
ncbi:MAG: hypothetical protein KAS32_07300 [Candidatus Peribacteraceae bacterium]|nr:hypothetical protein [Candidatus Peribacteraceae bacterium]